MSGVPQTSFTCSDNKQAGANIDGVGAVRVRATARLHLGFLDLNGGLGRRFGSLGMALDGPETAVTLTRATHENVTGHEQQRVRQYLAILQSVPGLSGPHRVHVASSIPPHSGLGSGTQLALALAAGLRSLHGQRPDLAGDAARLARGARSGVGIALFQSGGVALDGGRGAASIVPPPLARLPVPEAWRVLLLRDPARQGLSGASEHAAFAALPPMKDTTADRLCRLATMQALPALAEGDLASFGAAVTEIQRLVGAYFAPAQGGAACVSPAVGAALEILTRAGATGLGQTSWGPTGFAFAADDDEARRLADLLRRQAGTAGLDISIRRPRNRGAEIALDEGS